ncbi:hypothetical protein [Streptomyces sp. B6B3]|uniref:hypothetical protein n=1 Tax=Streptomyces sp. B6B3 TaxID=3153570 RepID=UPI00325C477C
MCAQPAEPVRPAWPTRSPYRIEPDEGPQSIAELKTALGPWPQELAAFTARLEAVPVVQHLERIRDLVAEYRMVWLSRTHPAIRAAENAAAERDGPDPEGVFSDEVWADYDDDFELRPDAVIRAVLGDPTR